MIQHILCLFFRFFGIYGIIQILFALIHFLRYYVYEKIKGYKNPELEQIKWALVTGSTSGLGWKMVEEMVDLGIGLVCLGRNPKKLQQLEQMFQKKKFKQYKFVQQDLGVVDQNNNIDKYIQKWKQIFEEMPPLDLIINNAGISYKDYLEDIKYEKYLEIVNCTLIAPIIITNQYLKSKNNIKKRILLSSSGMSKIPCGYSCQYSYQKYLGNVFMNYFYTVCQKNNINSLFNSVLLGQFYSNTSNYTNLDWSPDNDQNNSQLSGSYITSKEAAQGVLYHGLGQSQVEVYGHPKHALKMFLLNSITLPIAINLWNKKRKNFIHKKIQLILKQQSMIKFKLFLYGEKTVRRNDIEHFLSKQQDQNIVTTFKEFLLKKNFFDEIPLKYPISQLFGKQLEQTVFCQFLGYFPYFYVKIEHIKDLLDTKEKLIKFAREIEYIAQKDYKKKNKQFIHNIEIVKKYDFYGFNQNLQTFLKIELYSASLVKKIGNMLQYGVMGGHEFKCYEIHIENEIKFYKDHNLGGFGNVSIRSGFMKIEKDRFQFQNFSFCQIEIFCTIDQLQKNRYSSSKKLSQKKWLTKNLLLLWREMFKQFPKYDFKQERKFINQKQEDEVFMFSGDKIKTDFRKDKDNKKKLKQLQSILKQQVDMKFNENVLEIDKNKEKQFLYYKDNQAKILKQNLDKKIHFYKERTKREKCFIDQNKHKKPSENFTNSQEMLYYSDKQHYKHQEEQDYFLSKDSQTKFLKLKKPAKLRLDQDNFVFQNDPTQHIQQIQKNYIDGNTLELAPPPRIKEKTFIELRRFTVSNINDILYFYPKFRSLFNREVQKIFNKRYQEDAYTKKFLFDLYYKYCQNKQSIINLCEDDKFPQYYKVPELQFHKCQSYKKLHIQKQQSYEPKIYQILKKPPKQQDLHQPIVDIEELFFKLGKQKQKEQDKRFMVKYFAIEVFGLSKPFKMPDPQQDQIIYIFIQTKDEQIIICNTDKFTNNYINYQKKIILCRNEIELLKVFTLVILFYDPDIYIGFDVEKFSVGFIKERCKTLNLKVFSYASKLTQQNYSDFFQDFRIENCEFINLNEFLIFAKDFIKKIPQKQTYKSSFVNVKEQGRIAVNLSRIYKEDFKLKGYSLETVYYKFYQKNILNIHNNTLQQFYIDKNYKSLVDYYCDRLDKTRDCFEKSLYLQRSIQFSRLYGITIAQIHRGSQYKIEACMIRVCHRLNQVLLSSNTLLTSQQSPLQFKAYNLEPPRSLFFEPVVVLDFQSFYPSIMISHNMCYSTLLGNVNSNVIENKEINFGFTSNNVQLDKIKLKDVIVTNNGSIFVNKKIKKGVIPQILEEFIQTRIMLKKCKKLAASQEQQDDINIKQQILKLFMNVMYGYTSAGFSGKMPCCDIGDAVVSTARTILYKTMRRVEQMNDKYKVIYGDTDSLFILFRNTSVFQAQIEAKKIVLKINELLPKPIELNFEKVYCPFFINSKKKYCGIKQVESKQDFEAKGLEMIRTDNCPFVENQFEKLIKDVFTKPDLSTVKKFFVELFQNLQQNNFPLDNFIFSRRFKHKTYKNKIPSVMVVEDLQKIDRMLVPSNKHTIQYVFVKSCKEQLRNKAMEINQFIQRQDYLEIDYEYYIKKQLGSPLGRFFDGLGIPQKCLDYVLNSY